MYSPVSPGSRANCTALFDNRSLNVVFATFVERDDFDAAREPEQRSGASRQAISFCQAQNVRLVQPASRNFACSAEPRGSGIRNLKKLIGFSLGNLLMPQVDSAGYLSNIPVPLKPRRFSTRNMGPTIDPGSSAVRKPYRQWFTTKFGVRIKAMGLITRKHKAANQTGPHCLAKNLSFIDE